MSSHRGVKPLISRTTRERRAALLAEAETPSAPLNATPEGVSTAAGGKVLSLDDLKAKAEATLQEIIDKPDVSKYQLALDANTAVVNAMNRGSSPMVGMDIYLTRASVLAQKIQSIQGDSSDKGHDGSYAPGSKETPK